jgi:hypothetical protein
MIRFTLRCENGHGFESWFRDNASYDRQARAGLVECPVCGSARVEKAIMAPNVARTDKERAPAPLPILANAQPDSAPALDAPVEMAALPPEAHAMREMIRAFRKHVESTADNVGSNFADEARKMHFGEIEHRAIYGSATPDEVKELREDGVEAHPLPALPDDRN